MKAGLKTRVCKQCGQGFEVTHKTALKRPNPYCSRECTWQAQKDRARASWPTEEEARRLYLDNQMSDSAVARKFGRSAWWATNMRRNYGLPTPKYEGRMIRCDRCGESFYAKPSELHRGRRFCSQKCARAKALMSPEQYEQLGDKLSRTRRGKANPNYKHGKSDPMRVRRSKFHLRLKGERCCRSCGTTENLGLHHALPRSFYKPGREELRNGIPLCTRCHMGWHRRYVTIYRDAFTRDEWTYVSSAELIGQEIGPWLDERYPDRGRPFYIVTDEVRFS